VYACLCVSVCVCVGHALRMIIVLDADVCEQRTQTFRGLMVLHCFTGSLRVRLLPQTLFFCGSMEVLYVCVSVCVCVI